MSGTDWLCLALDTLISGWRLISTSLGLAANYRPGASLHAEAQCFGLPKLTMVQMQTARDDLLFASPDSYTRDEMADIEQEREDLQAGDLGFQAIFSQSSSPNSAALSEISTIILGAAPFCNLCNFV
jgi:hypothetical protein